MIKRTMIIFRFIDFTFFGLVWVGFCHLRRGIVCFGVVLIVWRVFITWMVRVMGIMGITSIEMVFWLRIGWGLV